METRFIFAILVGLTAVRFYPYFHQAVQRVRIKIVGRRKL